MTARVREVLAADTDRACPLCGGCDWWVAILASAPEADGAGGTFVDLSPAPMARCAGCGLSGSLEGDVSWEP